MDSKSRSLSSEQIKAAQGTVIFWGLLLCLIVFASMHTAAQAQTSGDTTARGLLQEGRTSEALSLIDKELKKRPRDGQLLLLKGAALSASDKKNEAIKLFRQMVSDKIEEASAYNNLAVIYASRGDFDAARSALEWAIRSKPDYSTAYHNLGNVYANLAGQSYRQALQLDRGDRSIPAKLARLGEVLGKPADEPAVDSSQRSPDRDEAVARVNPGARASSARLSLARQDELYRQ